MGLLSSLVSLFTGDSKKKTSSSSSKKKTSSSSSKKSVTAAQTYTPKTPTVSTPKTTTSVSTPTNFNAINQSAQYASQGLPILPLNTPSSSSNNTSNVSTSNKSVAAAKTYNKTNPSLASQMATTINPLTSTNPLINNTLHPDGTPKYTVSSDGKVISNNSVNKNNYSTLTTNNKTSNSSSSIPNGAFSYLAPSTDSLMEQAAAELNAASGASGYSSSGGSGGGGVSVPNTQPIGIDLSDILAAYTASAEAQKKAVSDSVAAQKKMLEDNLAAQLKTLETSEASQREALLTSLKRFQEDTAKARSQQQSSFNANRADLEAQAFMANRAAMQSAASRGLGGSGLQQLAQLQNLINQSGEVNELATGNTEALNTLAQNLARQEQDTTTNINNIVKEMQNKKESLTTEQKNTLSALLSEEVNNLNKIETNTTSLKEELKYQEAVRAENARVQAEQFAANLKAQNASIAANQAMYNQQLQAENKAIADSTISGLAAAVTDYSNLIKSASNSSTSKKPATALAENNKAVQAQYDAAISALASIYAGSGLSQSYLDTYRKQLDSVYSQYYKG